MSGSTESITVYAKPRTRYINTIATQSYVVQPRVRVMLGTTQLPLVKSMNISSTNNLTADRFEITFALRSDPAFNVNYWSTLQTGTLITLQAGYLPLDQPSSYQVSYKTLQIGQIDDIEIDQEGGNVTVHGRDLSSVFIDTKLSISYMNQTSSQIVQQIAALHGLQANVQATSGNVGRYFAANHNNTNASNQSKHVTEWDFMCWLAQVENYDLYVQGNTLYFQPCVNEATPNAAAGTWLATAPTFDLINGVSVWSQASNIENLKLKRSLTLAKDIKVIVQGWHSKKGTMFKATAQRSSGSSSANVQTYVYTMRNITQQQAQTLANNFLSDISRHEFLIEFSAPADLNITSRSLVKLTNTDSAFDIKYLIDNIDFSFRQDGPFTMDVRCKNHNPKGQVTQPS